MNDIAVIKAQNENLAIQAKSLKIVDQGTYNLAADILKAVKLQDKAIHEILDPEVDSAHKAHKAATANRKLYLDPLEAIEKALKPAMSQYIALQDQIRREAERKAREEQKAKQEMLKDLGMEEESLAVTMAPVEPQVQTAGISYRETWEFEILDPNLIPRQYLSIDESKIRQAVTALKQATEIPGVKVFSKKTPVVR